MYIVIYESGHLSSFKIKLIKFYYRYTYNLLFMFRKLHFIQSSLLLLNELKTIARIKTKNIKIQICIKISMNHIGIQHTKFATLRTESINRRCYNAHMIKIHETNRV